MAGDHFTSKIEPGVQQVFKLFVFIEWLFLGVVSCGWLFSPDGHWPVFIFLMWAATSLLLVLLFVPWFAWIPSKVFLLITLILSSLAPVVGLHLDHFIQFFLGIEPIQFVDSGNLLMLLLVPLLLVSMQYSLFWMLFFTLGTALLDLILGGIFSLIFENPLLMQAEENLIRTMLFLMIGLVVVRLSQAQKRQKKTLKKRNRALKAFASTQESLIVSQERNRMARELHDTLSHTLTALTVQLGAAEVLLFNDPDQTRQILRQAQEMTREGANETRRVLTALRAKPLEELGFRDAVLTLAKRTSERFGIPCKVNLPARQDRLPESIAHTLFRVIEEALQNACQHAQASRIVITLAVSQEDHAPAITLCIHDDGVGFDPEAAAEKEMRFGIASMRERVQLSGGEFQISSQVGQGTEICIVYPEIDQEL